MRRHNAQKEDIAKHGGLVTDAQKDAQASRAQADQAARQAQGIPGCVFCWLAQSMRQRLEPSPCRAPLKKAGSCIDVLKIRMVSALVHPAVGSLWLCLGLGASSWALLC